MALSHGRFTAVMPGPTVIPERVLNAMHRAPPNIYSSEAASWNEKLKRDVCSCARTEQNVAMYIGNGHVAAEAAIHNLLSAGDLVLVVEVGMYSKSWGETAKAVGVEVESLTSRKSCEAVSPELLEQRLREDTEHKIKAVMTVHTDTSTTVCNDLKGYRAALDSAQHPALFLVDAIATMVCMEFEFDLWGIDVCLAGSQKGFMVPPGVSFTLVSHRALRVRATKNFVPQYFDWSRRIGPSAVTVWGGTAPTHHVYGLSESLDMILREEGLENVWARHTVFAEAIWAAVDVWGTGGPIKMFVPDRSHRARTVSLVVIEGHDCEALVKWCLEEANLLLAKPVPYANSKRMFRLGHMGHLNVLTLLGTLATIQCGFKALGIPHGFGALDAAAESIASGWKVLPRSMSAAETMSGGSRLVGEGPVAKKQKIGGDS